MGEPTNLPPELLKVWREHRDKMDKYDMEHQYNGFTERYYNLARKHERICEVLEKASARAKAAEDLESLKGRVRDLPSDCDYYGMRDAVNALKNDVAKGVW